MSAKLIPERLKFVRENMGITMAEASRRLNLSKIGYCRYESPISANAGNYCSMF